MPPGPSSEGLQAMLFAVSDGLTLNGSIGVSHNRSCVVVPDPNSRAAAAVTWVLWDIIITFDQEVRYRLQFCCSTCVESSDEDVGLIGQVHLEVCVSSTPGPTPPRSSVCFIAL